MKSQEFLTEVDAYVRAKYPFIWIRSPEEREVLANLAQLAKSSKRGLRLWSIVSGFTALDGSAAQPVNDPQAAMMQIPEDSGRSFYIMRDFHPFVDPMNPANVPIIRTIRECRRLLNAKTTDEMKTVIFLSPVVKLPPELENEIVLLDWPMPNRERLGRVLDQAMGAFNATLEPDEKEAVITAALGLTAQEAGDCLSKSWIKLRKLDANVVKDEKKQVVERAGVLSWVEPEGGLDQVAGLDALKVWLQQRRAGFSVAAQDYGLDAPRGMLCLGVAGTGKSLTVKCTGAAWNMPVLSVQADKIKGQYVGESEQKLRKVLVTAETVAPCILFIDELEKLMAGADASGQTNGGVEANQLGILLNWMQDRSKEKPVFVAATANSIEGLPPELLRAGRFDAIWFVDLPNPVEREGIFKVHLSKRKRKPEDFDLEALVKASRGYSGAEIEACVVDGMFQAFADDGREVTTQDIIDSIERTVPLSETAKEKIDRFRKDAKGRARPASTFVAEGEGVERFDGLDLGDSIGVDTSVS